MCPSGVHPSSSDGGGSSSKPACTTATTTTSSSSSVGLVARVVHCVRKKVKP